MRKLIYVCVALLLSLSVKGQPRAISGRLTDSRTNEPIAGATVKSKKNGIVAISGLNGDFSLVVSQRDTLFISSIGYEILALPITSLDSVPLKVNLIMSTTFLDEITVNTGYQSLSKERATGSFSKIDLDKFNQQVSTDIIGRLEAVGNSVMVSRAVGGANGQLMIRGLSTIQGPKQPLIILDNFPYEGDLDNLNPNIVQDITILKDAAASSIWGTKAGNGVIVITTKKGGINEKVKLDMNVNTTMGEKPNLSYLPLMKSDDFIDLEKFLFEKQFRFSDTANLNRPPFSPVYEILFKQRSGRLSEAEASQRIDALRGNDFRRDLDRYYYRSTFNQQYAMNLNGGSNRITWLLFGGYDKDQDEGRNRYERTNVRFQNTYSPIKQLQVMLGVQYTHSANEAGKPTFSEINTTANGSLPPYTSFIDKSGNPLPVIRSYRQSYVDTAGRGNLLDWSYYPLVDYKNNEKTTLVNDLLANIGFMFHVTSWLKADIKYQYEKQVLTTNDLKGVDSYYTRDLINRFTEVDRVSNAVVRRIPLGGILDLTNANLSANHVRGQVNFDKVFKKFEVNAITGGEISDRLSGSNSYRTYGYDDDILTFAEVDYVNTYPTYLRGTKSFIPNNKNFLHNRDRFVSVYTNGAVSYDNKYTFSISGRRDASNLFGVNTNNRWTPLWSSGLSWDISKESFFGNRFLQYLKLRITYGMNGNINPDATAVTTISYSGTSPYTQTATAVIDKFYNPDLKWEKVGIFNVGLDFGLRGNVVSGSLEFYQKSSHDLFGNVPIDYTTGLVNRTITKNVASMAAHGVDIELNSVNVNADFSWMTNLNISFYKDKVTEYYLASFQGSNFVNGGKMVAGLEGKPVYSVFSYPWAGLDPENGDPIGYLNGEESKDYQTIIGNGTTISDLIFNGSSIPAFSGSMGNTFSYRNFSLTARLLFKFDYYFQRSSISYSSLYNNRNGHADYALRWQKPGDERQTTVPSLVYPAVPARDSYYNGSEILVDRADHIRVQYLNLGYDLHSLVKKSKLRALNIYVAANNLGIIWKSTKTRIDPEYSNVSAIPSPAFYSLGFKGTL